MFFFLIRNMIWSENSSIDECIIRSQITHDAKRSFVWMKRKQMTIIIRNFYSFFLIFSLAVYFIFFFFHFFVRIPFPFADVLIEMICICSCMCVNQACLFTFIVVIAINLMNKLVCAVKCNECKKTVTRLQAPTKKRHFAITTLTHSHS